MSGYLFIAFIHFMLQGKLMGGWGGGEVSFGCFDERGEQVTS